MVKGHFNLLRSSPNSLLLVSMSWVDVCLTTDSWVSLVNAQTWQASSSHGAALRLEKSEGIIAEPDTWCTEAWYWLTVDRNVDMGA